MLLTAGNHDLERRSVRIDNLVDFGRQSSARTSKAFAGAILDATCVLMCSDYRVVDNLHLGIVPMRDGRQETDQNACGTPSHEAIAAAGVGTVALRQITPRCSRSRYPGNAVQGTPVIYTRDALRFVTKDWCYQPPFGVGKGVSRVQGSFSELESRRDTKRQCLPCPQTLRHGPLGRTTT